MACGFENHGARIRGTRSTEVERCWPLCCDAKLREEDSPVESGGLCWNCAIVGGCRRQLLLARTKEKTSFSGSRSLHRGSAFCRPECEQRPGIFLRRIGRRIDQ